MRTTGRPRCVRNVRAHYPTSLPCLATWQLATHAKVKHSNPSDQGTFMHATTASQLPSGG
jgi:hypothetical protein